MAKTILVVDDEPDIVRSLEEHLVGAGYQVVTALDGREALQKAAAEKPDLIVLDDLMPSMHGLEVLRRLKDNPRTANIPIIMSAAEAQPDYCIRHIGCWDCWLTKPVNPSELLMYIQRIFDLLGGSTCSRVWRPHQGRT
jgi:CheY-like chemotaxis protein